MRLRGVLVAGAVAFVGRRRPEARASMVSFIQHAHTVFVRVVGVSEGGGAALVTVRGTGVGCKYHVFLAASER